MVYQEPGKALNPSIRAGRQVAEVYEVAGPSRDDGAWSRAEDMLAKVQISDPGRVMDRYPHQLSGGMAQRVVIAMALAAEPSLLILDEPTTALDATVEAEVLDLVAGLRAELNTSVLFISHNLAVIAKMCDRVGVLYAGELVEEGPAEQVFDEPRHPYTVGLLRCIPRRGQRKDHGRLDTIPGFLPPPGQQHARLHLRRRAARSRRTGAARPPPPAFAVGPGRTSRCYRHEEAAELPRTTPADVELRTRPGGRSRAGHHAARRVQDLRRRAARRSRRWRGVDLDRAARRDARPGRRVRQRQDHAGAGAARADRRRTQGSVVELDGTAAVPPTSAHRSRRAAAGRCRSCSRTRTRR